MTSRIYSSMALVLIAIAGSGCAFVIRTGSALNLGCDSSRTFQSGDGTSGNPYQICAPEHFANLGNTAGVFYKLTADIDLSNASRIASFSGTLDGNGHTISGYVGTAPLFTSGTGVTVKNLTLEEFVITGSGGSGYSGVVFGEVTEGTFEDLTLRNLSASNVSEFGFLAGSCYSCIVDTIALSASTASGTSILGGLFGYLEGETYRRVIKNITVSTVTLTSGGSAVGAIAGSISSSELVNVSVSANVTFSTKGGLIVGAMSNAEIIDGVSSGNLTGNSLCGGAVGKSEGDGNRLIQVSTSGVVNCSGGSTGGLVGSNEASNLLISRSQSVSNITCGDLCGGLVGLNSATIVIANSKAAVTLSGADNVAGIIGNDGGSLHLSHTISDSTLTATGTLRGMVVSSGATPVVFQSFFNSVKAGTNSDDAASADFDTKTNSAGILDADTYWSFDTNRFWNITDGVLPTLQNRDLVSSHISCDPFRPSAGTGTAQDPYIVCAASQLLAGLSGSMKLVRDIALFDGGSAWTPLDATALTELNGDHHGIFGLTSTAGENRISFIDRLATGSSIKNIHIHGAMIADANLTGAILVSRLQGGTISDSSVSGEIDNQSGAWGGGFAGTATGGSVVNSTSKIRSFSFSAGLGGALGIAEATASDINISDVQAALQFTDPRNIGGDVIGGLIAFVRSDSSTTTIDNCSATGSITGGTTLYDRVGGLIGNLTDLGAASTTVSNSFAAVNISVSSNSTNIGGLIGLKATGAVDSSYAMGSVTGGRNVGGLIGLQQNGTVTKSYATGATDCAVGSSGGFIGRVDGGTITNAYATGNATGVAVGGFVGMVTGGSINNAYAKGVVTISGGGAAGGFAQSFTGGSFADCFFDTTTTTQGTTAGSCTGLVTADMLLNATYAAWDLINIWNPPGGTVYPTLR